MIVKRVALRRKILNVYHTHSDAYTRLIMTEKAEEAVEMATKDTLR